MKPTEIYLADDPDALPALRRAIADGQAVGLPTDTVYVLAVDPTAAGASDRLFALLRRTRDRDLTAIVASVDQALEVATAITPAARRLMESFWPGPLTLVLPRDPESPADLGDDELTVGVRLPGHPVTAALCAEIGPLAAATMADLETADDLADAYDGLVPVILDGGPCVGPPSTVVDATGEEPHLIREGRLPWAAVTAALH